MKIRPMKKPPIREGLVKICYCVTTTKEGTGSSRSLKNAFRDSSVIHVTVLQNFFTLMNSAKLEFWQDLFL